MSRDGSGVAERGVGRSRAGAVSTLLAEALILLPFLVGIGSWAFGNASSDYGSGSVAVMLSFYAAALLSPVGLALGAFGLLQRRRKRLFAVLGVAFNAAVLAGVLGLFWLGTRINS